MPCRQGRGVPVCDGGPGAGRQAFAAGAGAAKLAGIDEIYRIGGAQAIAALAHGTETIAPVAKIVGPGNALCGGGQGVWFRMVGIDMIAGPRTVLILADKTGNPGWIAADLLPSRA